MDEKKNTDKTEKLQEAIREISANFIANESNYTSLITVTRVLVSKNMTRATIFISVLPVEKEEEAINFLKRKRSELRKAIEKSIRTGRIPFLEVEIDQGEKNRQRIDELSNSK